MKIVMIDQNSIIDRRIVLEAEALIERGHDVELVCAEGSLGEWDKHSFKVTRISVYPESSPLDSGTSVDTAPIRDFKEKWRFLLGTKLALLVATFLMPKSGKKFALVANSLSPAQRYVLLGVLSSLTLDWKSLNFALVSLKEIFLGWYLRQFSRHVDFVPVELWERRVVEYLESQKFDVVHVHDLPVLRLGSFLKKRFRVKLVYDAHELYSYQPGISKQRAASLFAMEKQFISAADLVVLINDDQAKVMQKDFGSFPYVCLTNATKAPPGFDRSKKYDVIRERCGIPAEARVLLFQGGVNRLRKIHLLIEGVAKAKSAPHMVFLTWGSEIDDFKLLAKSLGIQNRCHFMQPIPWDEMVFWAASADLGVMPYQADDLNTKLSMPNKMYEFIVAGTPMIGSEKLLNVNKIVGGNQFGALANLVHAEDYAALIDFALAPDRLLTYRESLRVNGAKYSWRVLSADFVEAYDALFAPECFKNEAQPALTAASSEI